MKQIKFSIDEQDALTRLFLSDDYKVLDRILASIAEDYTSLVMKYDLHSGPEGLVITKARAEGVMSFIDALERFKKNYKEKVNG